MFKAKEKVCSAFPVSAQRSGPADAITDRQAMLRAVGAEGVLPHRRTVKWLATLPDSVRPMVTARQYSRIANRISDLWAHCEFTRLYLQSLVVDRHGGGKGLPAEVMREIKTLQQYYFENLSGLPALLWNAVPLVEPKIPHKIFAPIYQNTEIELCPLPR